MPMFTRNYCFRVLYFIVRKLLLKILLEIDRINSSSDKKGKVCTYYVCVCVCNIAKNCEI